MENSRDSQRLFRESAQGGQRSPWLQASQARARLPWWKPFGGPMQQRKWISSGAMLTSTAPARPMQLWCRSCGRGSAKSLRGIQGSWPCGGIGFERCWERTGLGSASSYLNWSWWQGSLRLQPMNLCAKRNSGFAARSLSFYTWPWAGQPRWWCS